MAMRKTHDAVYAGEKYTDRDGNEKTRYVNVGALFTRDDGSLTMKLESIPVNFNGWISFYAPKAHAGDRRTQQRQDAVMRPQPADDFSDSDIPF